MKRKQSKFKQHKKNSSTRVSIRIASISTGGLPLAFSLRRMAFDDGVVVSVSSALLATRMHPWCSRGISEKSIPRPPSSLFLVERTTFPALLDFQWKIRPRKNPWRLLLLNQLVHDNRRFEERK